ncbi:MAG: tripartite tricarboxylate transporter substrate binding protein [Alphaproteobacteria bacterium]|nr:tripartite tricarboxylate transporter substrate binding protein [Alphaproteobacteria bacterium]
MNWFRQVSKVALTLAAALSIGAAGAQTFPVKGKPITIIVPYAAGGVTDTGARMMAAGMEKELGTPVQIVNKAGAASQLGLTELSRSAPDGYTLSYAVLPTITTHYLDPTRAAVYTRANFQPIGLHHLTWMMLAVRTDSPYKTLRDLVEAARAKPESIKISDSGLMAVPHSQVLMLERAADVRFASVHFAGGAPSVTALLGGHVDVLAGSTADALANKKTGLFRVLGVAAEAPDSSMPEVPTMTSQGYNVLAASASGILAPAGTPKPVVDVLTAAMKKVIASKEHGDKLVELGIGAYYRDPEAYTQYWIDTETRMKPLMQTLKP